MRSPRIAVVLLLVVPVIAGTPRTVGDRSLPPPQRQTSAPAPRASVAEPRPLPVTDDPDRTLVVRTTRTRFLVYDRPASAARLTYVLLAENPWGQPLAYPVLEARDDRDGGRWYLVRLPIDPNGSTGWVRERDVEASRVRHRIVVDLSRRRLWWYKDGALQTALNVAVGATSTPTTPGSFFVWAQVSYDDPHGPYGAYALGLSGFSEVLPYWPGGGRMAIHGTDDPRDVGDDVSHGCVRVYNPQLRHLEGVPLGTPVMIRP
jgi:hypothetical protein